MPISLGGLLGGTAQAYTAYNQGQQQGRKNKLDEEVAGAKIQMAGQEASRKASADAERERQAEERLRIQRERLQIALDEFSRNDPDNRLAAYRAQLEARNEAERRRLQDQVEIQGRSGGRAARDAAAGLTVRNRAADNAVGAAVTQVGLEPPPGATTWNLQDPNFRAAVIARARQSNPELAQADIDAALNRQFGRATGARTPGMEELIMSLLGGGGLDDDDF